MSPPAPLPAFVLPPPFSAGNHTVRFWPEMPLDNDQSRMAPQLEFPPFKKPRNSDENPFIHVPNHNNDPRMPPPARGVSKIFFKTRPCEKFREGTCPYGSNCNFAHGVEDIRKPPPNWQEIVGFHEDDRAEKWDDDLKIITRHRLCKSFCAGKVCPYGKRCNYLHEDPGKFREEFGRFRESSAISISTTGVPVDNGARPEQSDSIIAVNSRPAWKTKMCNKWWETSGNCPFGDKCHFAHGLAELKKFGGHNEVEMANVVPAPPKPLPNPANDASLENTVVGGSCRKPVLNKFLSKWKGPEKINRIYADWIDDISPTKSSPSKLEN